MVCVGDSERSQCSCGVHVRNIISGLEITAGHRSMSGQNHDLTGQMTGTPVILVRSKMNKIDLSCHEILDESFHWATFSQYLSNLSILWLSRSTELRRRAESNKNWHDEVRLSGSHLGLHLGTLSAVTSLSLVRQSSHKHGVWSTNYPLKLI